MKKKILLTRFLALFLVGVGISTTINPGDLQGRFGAPDGGVSVELAADTPREDIVVAGRTDVDMTKYRLSSTTEDFVVQELQVRNIGVLGSMDNNIRAVTLRYQDSMGATIEENGVLVTGVATFAGLDLYVPADETVDLEILADLNDITPGATSATPGEKIQLFVAGSGFKAIGLSSGVTIVDFSGDAPQRPAIMHVYESKPSVALAGSSPVGARSVSATDDVFVFTVTADSEEKIIMKGLTSNFFSDMDFETAALTTATFKESGITLGSAPIVFTDASTASATFRFAVAPEISADTTKAFTISLDTAALLNEDPGVDDPFTTSIELGSSTMGVVTRGGFLWNETNANVGWVGNVASTVLYGNTLLY